MFWTRCHIIGSYNLLLHICCMCCKPWYFSHCAQTWLCNVQTFCLQDPSLSGHAAHPLSFGTNPVSEVFESDVPNRSIRWKQPFSIHTYVHTYAWSARGYTLIFCALGPPAGTTRNFLVSMLRQKKNMFICGNPMNMCVHIWIYTYNKTAQHNPRTQ